MTNNQKNILFIEDDYVDQIAIKNYIKSVEFPFTFQLVESINAALEILETKTFDAIVSDFSLGDGNAFEILDKVKDIPIIVVTGTGSEEIAVEALKKGAYDYLLKDIDGNHLKILAVTVQKALSHFENEKELKEYHTNLEKLVEKRTIELTKEIETRKKAEKEISLSWEFLNTLINGIADPIFVKDDQHTWIVLNDAICKLLGKPKSELLGKSDYDVFPKEQADIFWVQDDIVLKDGNTKIIENEEQLMSAYGLKTISTIKSSFINPITSKKNLVGTIRDITEKKQADLRLKESRTRLSTLMSNLPGMAYQCKKDDNWTMIFINEACEQLTGYLPTQLIDNREKSYKDLIHEDDREYVNRKVEKAFRAKDHFEIEYRIIVSGNIEKWVWERGIIIDSYNKEEKLIEGVIHDITERKQAEKAFRESEEKWIMYMANANDAVAIIQDRSYKYLNNAGEKLFGYSHKEILGLNVVDTISKDYVNLVHDRYLRRVRGEIIPSRYEAIMKRKDGTLFDVEISATVIQYDGRPGVMAIFRDITESKKSAVKLKESEEYFRALIENSNDVISILDETGKILYESPSQQKVLKYNIGELIGENIFDLVHPDDQRNLNNSILRLTNEFGKKVPVNFRFLTKTGDWLDIEGAGKNLLNSPTVKGIVVNFRDVSERRKAEENLKYAFEDLERSKLQLRALNIHAQNIREKERTEISREIHDVLGQALTALKLDLSWIQKKSNITNNDVLNKIGQMKVLIDETTSTVQRISTELRPGLLDDLGLTYALEWQCKEFEKRSEIKCKLKITPKNITINEKISVGLFRIVQEALTNIVRHSKATKVEIILSKKKNLLNLKIIDNGIGINKKDTKDPKSLGLLGITERAYAINGDVSFSGQKNIGTEVNVNIYIKKGS